AGPAHEVLLVVRAAEELLLRQVLEPRVVTGLLEGGDRLLEAFGSRRAAVVPVDAEVAARDVEAVVDGPRPGEAGVHPLRAQTAGATPHVAGARGLEGWRGSVFFSPARARRDHDGRSLLPAPHAAGLVHERRGQRRPLPQEVVEPVEEIALALCRLLLGVEE